MCARFEKILEFESPFPHPETPQFYSSFYDFDVLALKEATSCAIHRDKSTPTKCYAYNPSMNRLDFENALQSVLS